MLVGIDALLGALLLFITVRISRLLVRLRVSLMLDCLHQCSLGIPALVTRELVVALSTLSVAFLVAHLPLRLHIGHSSFSLVFLFQPPWTCFLAFTALVHLVSTLRCCTATIPLLRAIAWSLPFFYLQNPERWFIGGLLFWLPPNAQQLLSLLNIRESLFGKVSTNSKVCCICLLYYFIFIFLFFSI